MIQVKISVMGLQGNDLRLENLDVARQIARQGGFDEMVLEDVHYGGVEPKWIQLSWRPEGQNRKVIRKRICGKTADEDLSRLDMEQLMSNE